ncbi:cell division cycle protein 20 homolog [Rhinoraja longicauda]
MVWKYNKMGSVTMLRSQKPVECLSYTQKEPILLFSGHSDGTLIKWERQQSSYFLYSRELFNTFEAQSVGKGKHRSAQVARRRRALSFRSPAGGRPSRAEESPGAKRPREPNVPCSFTRSVFVEELDMLVLAADDGNIYLWGFDDSLSSILKMMPSRTSREENSTRNFECLPKPSVDRQYSLLEEENESPVTNRVSGFVCKKVLSHHTQPVGGVAVVGRDQGYDTDYLISGGWDRQLCVWDLQVGELHNTFCNTAPGESGDVQELACDGAILDLVYSPKRNEFAYSSSDGMVYIRHFSPITSEMKLVSILQGHEADITAILWHSLLNKWISGSEDGTIRIWSEAGSQCEQILVTHEAVNCLCTDQHNGCILAGLQKSMSVYDPETLMQVQRNTGHTDSIRSIVHIPERSQYVTASWDCTVRVWNAYIKLPPKNKETRKSTNSATS